MMYYETYYVMANKQILFFCDGKDIFNSHYSQSSVSCDPETTNPVCRVNCSQLRLYITWKLINK